MLYPVLPLQPSGPPGSCVLRRLGCLSQCIGAWDFMGVSNKARLRLCGCVLVAEASPCPLLASLQLRAPLALSRWRSPCWEAGRLLRRRRRCCEAQSSWLLRGIEVELLGLWDKAGRRRLADVSALV